MEIAVSAFAGVPAARADVALRAPGVRGALHGFLDGLVIEVIALALGQQKDVLMRLRASVVGRLGHGVRLAPNDVLAKPPSSILKRKRQAPRLADEILVLQAVRLAR
jgi:hypothetical protein